MSDLEIEFERQLKMVGIKGWVTQLEFAAPLRKFRFDFAFPEEMLAVEIQGGTFTKGGHSTGSGIQADCDKLAEAIIRGWQVFHFTAKMVKDISGLTYLEQALGIRPLENPLGICDD